MSQHDEERTQERAAERLTKGWRDHRIETWASADIEAIRALLDDPRLRRALGYLEDCGADEIWLPLRTWIEDRDDMLRKLTT